MAESTKGKANVSGQLKISPVGGLNKFNKHLDTGKVLDDAAVLIADKLRTRFLATQTPSGGLWPPSKAALRRGGDRKTLFDTGQLFSSIGISDSNVSEDRRRVGVTGRPLRTDKDRRGRTKSNFTIGRIHNFGLRQDGRKFPAREFIGLAGSDLDAIEELLSKLTPKDLGL